MHNALDKIDVTDRTVSGGWILPAGWTVQADMANDDVYSLNDFDCYTASQVAAWHAGDWSFGYISVWVEDQAGRIWGNAGIGGVEYGDFTMTDEDDTFTGTTWIDPLNAQAGEYSPVREYDLIGEALRDAVRELERFGTPVLVEPTGTNYSGL